MLATSEATFPVFFATRFTSQVPNVTEVRLFKCIHRITKQNFVNDIQSTYEDLLKNSEYYFSHENGMEGSGSFISAMLGTDDTNTNHLLMWEGKKEASYREKKPANSTCIRSFLLKQNLPWGTTGGSSVRFLSNRCPVTIGTDQTTEMWVWRQPIFISNRSFRLTISS